MIRPGGSSDHCVTTSDPRMSFMAITDQNIVDHEPTGLDRTEPSDATLSREDPWHRTQTDPWRTPIEEPHMATNTNHFESDNSWVSTAIDAEHLEPTQGSSSQLMQEEAAESDVESLDAWAARVPELTDEQPSEGVHLTELPTVSWSSSEPSVAQEASGTPNLPQVWHRVTNVDSNRLNAIGFWPAWSTQGGEVLQNNEGELYWNMTFPLSMAHREGSALLLDTGSPTNLIGETTSQLMEKHALAKRRAKVMKLDRETPMRVKGVGHGHHETWQGGLHHIGLGRECDATFRSPVMPASELPAISGGNSLREHRSLIDCEHDCVLLVGPGCYQITLSPGSRRYPLEPSEGGHWMLPCSDYPDNPT
ncbi:hypothetical protein N9L68_02070 [bacterium]|nr:hypothetical protein [bacterium]